MSGRSLLLDRIDNPLLDLRIKVNLLQNQVATRKPFRRFVHGEFPVGEIELCRQDQPSLIQGIQPGVAVDSGYDQSPETTRQVRQFFQILLDRVPRRNKQMPQLRPHVFSPVREKLAVAGIGRLTEKARFGSVISSAFAYPGDLSKQFRFERLN